MLMWHCINEERDDKSFTGVERVSSPSTLFPKYGCICWKQDHEISIKDGLSVDNLISSSTSRQSRMHKNL